MKDFVGLSGRRFVSLMIAVLLLGGGSLPFLFGAAGEDDEAGICARALSNCLGTAGSSALALDWKAVIKALAICIVGYEFCRDYIEPYIRDGCRP